MFSTSKKPFIPFGGWILGLCLSAMGSATASATEYRLFVNDTAACRSAGVTGSVCLVAVGTTTTSSSTSVTSTASTASTGTATTGTAAGCTVTTWNPCSNSVSSSAPSSSSTSVVSSSSSVSVASSSPVTVTTAPATTAPVTPGSVSAGNLDFGSGGGNATGRTYGLSVGYDTVAYPFTVKTGPFFGQVSIVPTSAKFPDDGTGVRLWLSKTAGGTPLAGGCARTAGSTGALWWDQTGTLGYGCSIPNTATTLYLNVRACISETSDTTCSSARGRGGYAPIYISGSLARN